MTIIRVSRYTDPYSRIKRDVIQDGRLSWSAKGMLAYLLSLPESWEPHVSHLIKVSTGGRDAVYTIIKELRKYGYMEHHRQRDEAGRVQRAYYIVYEEPLASLNQLSALLPAKPEEVTTAEGLPHPVSPDVVNPDLEKPDVLNNKYIKKHTKKDKETAAMNERKQNVTNCSAAGLSDKDLIIQEQLTDYQMTRIKELAEQLAPSMEVSQEELTEHLTITIANPKSFSAAGQEFSKKLNTIKKTMLLGKWTPPAEQVIEKVKAQEKSNNEIKFKILETKAELEQIARMLSYNLSESSKEHWLVNEIKARETLGKLNEELKVSEKKCAV